MSETRRIRVRTPSRSYDVLVGRDLLDGVGRLTREACGGRRACVVSDSNVAPLYANAVAESLADAGYECTAQAFEAGEGSKNMGTLADLLEGLARAGLDRDDVVIAVGGGVTGDIAGLAGAMYLRGCKVVQVPTSLLAMVDSSVGGKTAVDLSAGKNLAGFFFQPHLVIADVDCLDTLTPSLFTDSCGEVIKHAAIADAGLLARLGEEPINAQGYDRGRLVEVIARNVRIKRDVVERDEREGGLRQVLNFGHTIGHAVEAASSFELGHGSSVAVGMCCIARASAARGWCTQDVADRIVSAVDAYGLPTGTDIDHRTIVSFAAHDKKRHGAGVNVVTPRALGAVEVRHVTLAELAELVELGCAPA